MFIVTSKREIEENCFALINEWIHKSEINAKIVYRSWIDKDNAYIKYDGQPLNVKCDFCLFLILIILYIICLLILKQMQIIFIKLMLEKKLY